MAKKKQQQQKGSNAPKGVPHRDNYARVSYLYQLSTQLSLQHNHQPILSRAMTRNLDLVGKKAVLKLGPSLKRSICKKCNSLLIPGLTMQIRLENLSRLKSSHNDVLIHKCLNCNEVKRFPIGKDREYIVFPDRDGVRIDS